MRTGESSKSTAITACKPKDNTEQSNKGNKGNGEDFGNMKKLRAPVSGHQGNAAGAIKSPSDTTIYAPALAMQK